MKTYFVNFATALMVLDATGDPLTDNQTLQIVDGFLGYASYAALNHLERIVRSRVRKLGLELANGKDGEWPVRAHWEAVWDRNPAQSCEEPPRAAEQPRTGWPKASEVEPVSHADPYQYGSYERPRAWG